MDYSTPGHQLYAMLHYSFAFILLFVIWPRFFLVSASEDAFENKVALFVTSVCLYIVVIYALVVLKLYEVISISGILLLLSTRRFWEKGSAVARTQAAAALSVWFYRTIEIGFRLKTKWLAMRGKLTMARKHIQLNNAWNGDFLNFIILCGILGASAYVRFYDAVHTAAPAMSDGSVTLAWMKYVNGRILFKDGIYPQGFHMVLSLLSKFAAIDPLYILKYTGPLNGVLTAAGYYFVLSRLTGLKTAGLTGAALFGLGGPFLFTSEWIRQAAANSQEFAFVFVFPALYFFIRYLERGTRSALYAGTSALTATGLVHSLVYAYAGMGLGVALIASMLAPASRSWRRIGITAVLALATVIVSMLPIQAASWAGIPYNTSAIDYLTDTTEVTFPDLTGEDYLGLSAIAAIMLLGLIGWRNGLNRLSEWFAAGLGTASFLLYFISPVITQSTVLASRTGSLWMLAICFCTGFAWWSIWRFMPAFHGSYPVQQAVCAMAAVSLAVYTQLGPIETYKMDWESSFRVYLDISREYPPQTWTIFSEDEGYALIYGSKGFHNYIRTLVTDYDPTKTPITRRGQTDYDVDTTTHLFVIEMKEVFRVPKTLELYKVLEETDYKRHEEDMRLLRDWLAEYGKYHEPPLIYFEDEHIRVWYLARPDAEDRTVRRLWGTSQ